MVSSIGFPFALTANVTLGLHVPPPDRSNLYGAITRSPSPEPAWNEVEFAAKRIHLGRLKMRKFALAFAALLIGSVAAQADSLVTTRPVGTDSVSWAQLGGVGSAIPSPFAFLTANSVAGTGTYGSSGYLGIPEGEVIQQGSGWAGNFAPGDILNWTYNSGPLTLSFAQGYSQIGAQIQSDYFGAFTAQICDVNGCFSENGNSTSDNDNSAIYIGISTGGAPITWATFGVTSASSNPNDFAINDVTLNGATTTPEPGSLLLMGTGLVGFAGALRRKFAR
jgi:hypothetical protein